MTIALPASAASNGCTRLANDFPGGPVTTFLGGGIYYSPSEFSASDSVAFSISLAGNVGGTFGITSYDQVEEFVVWDQGSGWTAGGPGTLVSAPSTTGLRVVADPGPGSAFSSVRVYCTNAAAGPAITVKVAADPIVFSPPTGATLAWGRVGDPYSQAISASGGSGTFKYTVTSAGGAPPGLVLDPDTGLLSGIPTAEHSRSLTFKITATDAADPSSSQTASYTLSIYDHVTYPPGTVGVPYPDKRLPTRLTTPTEGSLPPGMSISGTGSRYILSGTPTQAGTYIFAFDNSSRYTLTIDRAAPTLAVSASDAEPALGTGVTFTATLSGGASPAGTVTFKDGSAILGTGTISGTTATFATDALTLGAHAITADYGGDANNTAATSPAIAVTVAGAPIVFSPPTGATLAWGRVGELYSQAISASGGSGAFKYTVTSAEGTPPGLVLDPDTGLLSGIPTVANTGGAELKVTATDAADPSASATATYQVFIYDNVTFPPGTVGVPYPEKRVATTGPTTPTEGGIPAGMVIEREGPKLLLRGTPEQAGTYTFTFGKGNRYNFVIDRGEATLAVSASDGTPALGTSITLTATLSGGASPTGTVTFKDGSTTLGTGTISGTTATFATDALTLGAHAITADYGGDANHVAATSAAIAVTVGQAAPTISVSASDSNPALGANVTFTATLSDGASPTGTVTFKDGETVLGTGTISGATATFATSILTVGAHAITAEYDGDANNAATTSSAVTVTVGQAAPTISVSASNSTPALGASVTFTATLSDGALPTGTVTFKDGETVLGTGTISGATATFATSILTVGAHAITAEYGGDINNTAATSSAVTVTVGQAAPTISVAASDSTPAFGANVTFTATLSDGASPTGTVMFKDGLTTLGTGAISGMTASFDTAALTVGTHAITAEYGGDANNAAVTSPAITLTVNPATPAISVSVSDDSPAFGASVTFTATLSDGASPTGTVMFKDGPTTLGTGAISGMTASFDTAALTVGTHAITAEYGGDANNAATTSSAITVTVVQAVPENLSVTPADGTLPAGVTGTRYAEAVSASGGVAPYSYAITIGALPDGLTLDAATGAISGMPTVPGTYGFTVTATDSASPANTGSAGYTLRIDAATAFVFSPPSGALHDAMAGEAYSVRITAAGGVGSKIYSVVAGALPAGMVLNASTGELTGPLEATTEGRYAFTVQVEDANGRVGMAAYTLAVIPRGVTVSDKDVVVPAGSTPPNVDLTQQATGGPFVDAQVVSVEPPDAGTASIVNGEFAQAGPVGPLGWYLKFTSNPAYAGQAQVRFRLISALGVSNIGVITYTLGFDAAAVVGGMDGAVHGFVQTRQGLIASTIEIPGLVERREMERALDPVTMRLSPADDGLNLALSTSLAQLEAAGNAANGIVSTDPSRFNVWLDGVLMLHNRSENGNQWGSFGMLSAGADYLLTEKALLGLSFHYDRMSDPTDPDTLLTGDGWLFGPYASFEIGDGVFWDTAAFYGGSVNSIDTAFWDGGFTTNRWLFDTSITGKWQIDAVTSLTPRLRAVYLSETVQDYTVTNGAGDVIDIDGFTTDQLRVSLGAEIARRFTLDDGAVLTPKLGATAGFSGLDGSGAFGLVSAGISYGNSDAWGLDGSLLFSIEGEGQVSTGAKIGISGKF